MDKEWRPASGPDELETEKPRFAKRMEDAPILGRADGPARSASTSGSSTLKYAGLVGLGIVVLVLLVFFGTRAVTGYAVYGALGEQGVPEQYITNVAGLNSDLLATKDSLAQTQAQLDQLATNYEGFKAQSEQQLTLLSSANDRLQTDLEFTRTTNNALMEEIGDARSALDDSARRLCCVQRILSDSTIDSYSLVDGTITCTTGGDTRISC